MTEDSLGWSCNSSKMWGNLLPLLLKFLVWVLGSVLVRGRGRSVECVCVCVCRESLIRQTEVIVDHATMTDWSETRRVEKSNHICNAILLTKRA